MGKVCVFFGHCDAVLKSKEELYLKQALVDLIQNKGVDTFWVGGYGNFDRLSAKLIWELKVRFAHISICLVLAYLPQDKKELAYREKLYDSVFVPEGVEIGLLKFAIIRRNRWMAQNADFVVCYTRHKFGGAYQAVQTAQQNQKQIIFI